MLIINTSIVVLLIIGTAFFVAAEFALVKVRPSRIDQLVMEGNGPAKSVRKVLDNLDGYLSACQLGITITALGLGMVGKPTVEIMLHPIIESFALDETTVTIISVSIAFALITFLHVVIGELAPKSLAIQKSEALSLLLARPLIGFYILMYPAIWALNGSARYLIRLFGIKPVSEHEAAHSEDELRIILSESLRGGQINKSEYKYVNNIFEFDDRLSKEVMVPRTQMMCLYTHLSFEENIKLIQSEQYTRYPVAEGDKDRIIGMVNVKDLFLAYTLNPKTLNLLDHVRPVLTVIESTPVQEILRRMQKERVHMAVLIDEYGGTAGLLTLEDIVEEIVGEIRDEFDAEEKPMVERGKDKDHWVFDGKVLIGEVNDLLGIELQEEEMDTIGGWLYTHLPEVKEGVELDWEGYRIRVKTMDRLRISQVEIRKVGGEITQS